MHPELDPDCAGGRAPRNTSSGPRLQPTLNDQAVCEPLRVVGGFVGIVPWGRCSRHLVAGEGTRAMLPDVNARDCG